MMKLGDLCGGETERLTAADDLMIDYIDISSVSNESKSIIGKQTLQSREAPSRAQRIIKADDILVSTVRPNLNAVAVYDGSFENLAVASTGFCVLRCKPGVSHRFVFNICKSNAFIKAMTEQATGASYPAVNERIIRAFEVPDLDYESQTRLAGRLDSIQLIIDLRKQQLRELDDLIKARFVEMFGDPEYNNKGWPLKRLNDICNVGSSKRIYQEEQTMEGVPFWRISDLVSKMDTGNVESSLFIPESRYEELKEQGLVPEPGDILVTSRGTLGRCYIVDPDDRFYFQDGMISWLSNYSDEIMPLYIQYLFDMSGFRKQIDGLQAGSTVAYLSIAMLKKLNVMVPSRKLQEQFAAFVSKIDKSKLSIQASLDQLETLKQSLMQKYFG